MISGMLWQVDMKETAEEQVRKAVAHYEKKTGRKATMCQVHPRMNLGGRVDGVAITTDGCVPMGHYLIGVEEE